MILIKYTLSVLLYILLLPISTPAAFIVSAWMRRNRLYGLKRWLAVDYTVCTTRKFRGNPAISDKHKIAGWLFVTARCHNKKLRAFEWYSVTPYTKTRCLRVRIGWKIKGDKFDEVGEFGALVFTINPFDTYGDD